MKSLKFSFPIVLLNTAIFVGAQEPAKASGQSSTAHHKRSKSTSASSIEIEIRKMREELQGQIDNLKTRLAAKDAQIEALQKANTITHDKLAINDARVDSVGASVEQDVAAVTGVQSSVATLQNQTASLSTNLQRVQTTQEQVKKSIEEPAAIHYKGITIVPGGFLAGESVWRQRALSADIYTNYNFTPYMNTGQAHSSEWVPSARQTRLSSLFTGSVPFGTLSGYFEGDFLSSGSTSNNLQSNSYGLRIRQAWGQVAFGRFKFTGGQMWTLLTENRKSTDAGQEMLPLFFDGNLHVGDTYLRQTGFRLQNAISPKVTVAVALENSQYQFAASNAPSNFFFGHAGAGPGLNNPLFTYTNQVAPDVLVKAAFDPAFGHYEIGGVARFFRDRYYPDTTTSSGAQNDTRLGGGFVANARFPVTPKLDLGFHLVAGTGTGRYGVSLLPDITVRPNGTLSPLRNAQGLLSLELHPSKKFDIFGYAGTEYVQRTFYKGSNGTLVGYAPTSANNTGCNTEAVPTSGTGDTPGSSPCLGATRALIQGSVGWLYRVYHGPAGRLQYGLAYSYLTRDGWAGVGGAPKATNNMIYTSFRYYIP